MALEALGQITQKEANTVRYHKIIVFLPPPKDNIFNKECLNVTEEEPNKPLPP